MAPTWGSGFKKLTDYKIPRTQLIDKGDDKKPPTTVKAAEKPAAKPSPSKPAPSTRRAYEEPGPSGGSTAKKKTSSRTAPKKKAAKAQSVLDAAKSRGGVETEKPKQKASVGPETESSDRIAKIEERKAEGFKDGAHKPRGKSVLRRAAGAVGKYARGVGRAVAGKSDKKRVTK